MNDKIELDKRKALILATVVYEYIATAEPVGSNTLTQVTWSSPIPRLAAFPRMPVTAPTLTS